MAHTASRDSDRERVLALEAEVSALRVELERSERRVEAMKQVGQILGSNLELDTLLTQLVECTTELLEADRSTLFLIDREKQELCSKVMQGNEAHEIRLRFGVGFAGWVAEHRQPLHVPDAYADPRFNPFVDRQTGYRTRCMLVWPVRESRGSRVIGVIQVLNKRGGAFDVTDERLLEAIAAEIGVALEAASLYGQLLQQNEAIETARSELKLLLDTERAISHSHQLEEMLVAIASTALGTLGAKTGLIYLLDDAGTQLIVHAAAGSGAESARRLVRPIEDPILGAALRTGQPVIENQAKEHRRGKIRPKRIVAVPIGTKYEGNFGVFELINRVDKRDFSESDARTLTVVASQAGRAISVEQRRKQQQRAERLTTIGSMLSGVVHDLRTPLTLISGYAQMMTMADAPAERRHFSELVHKQIDVMTAMTKDLLAFARGERTMFVRKVYVQKFMAEMQEMLSGELEPHHVALELDIRYRGVARFDETKLRRVFQNLARNAKEAMVEGGRFRVVVQKKGELLTFDFSDTGPGIPEALLPKLFEPFNTAGKPGGTGLGLAMVKRIAEEHGGTVRCESKAGKGTRFHLALPLGDGVEKVREPTAASAGVAPAADPQVEVSSSSATLE